MGSAVPGENLRAVDNGIHCNGAAETVKPVAVPQLPAH